MDAAEAIVAKRSELEQRREGLRTELAEVERDLQALSRIGRLFSPGDAARARPQLESIARRGAVINAVRGALSNLPENFTIADVSVALPEEDPNSIRKSVKRLGELGELVIVGEAQQGRATVYRKAEGPS